MNNHTIYEVEKVTMKSSIGYVLLDEGKLKVTFEAEDWTDGRPANPNAHHYLYGDNDMGEDCIPTEIKIITIYDNNDEEIQDDKLKTEMQNWLNENTEKLYEPEECLEPEWNE